MKKVIVPIMVLLLSLSAYGIEETLISDDIESGGYGGPEVKFGSINGEWEVLVGGRGGWIINHRFVLGGAGYGMATKGETNPGSVFPYLNDEFEIGYGGLLLGYISRSNSLIHVTADVLIGGGGLSPADEALRGSYDSDAFFILEPGVNFELNISRKVRFGFGTSYRIVSGIEYFDLDNENIGGTAINLILKFGKF